MFIPEELIIFYVPGMVPNARNIDFTFLYLTSNEMTAGPIPIAVGRSTPSPETWLPWHPCFLF